MENLRSTVAVARSLVWTINGAITWWKGTKYTEVVEELDLYAKDLKRHIGVLSSLKVIINTTSVYATDALREDLEQGRRDT
ncbi:hypothetical protein R1flu_009352 [Riccia fluitans]|uniref:Uncharacterized protein n=1 Tax=Riccia fluitans TaxID=41844 RepID=A0ABD1Z2P5_9MARC